MGIRGARERCLEILAYKYWLKNKSRSSEENWKKACKLIDYIDKRKSLIIKLLRIKNGKRRS